MKKRHKWEWSDGYHFAKCKKCGATIKRIDRVGPRGIETEEIYSLNGKCSPSKPMPECEGPNRLKPGEVWTLEHQKQAERRAAEFKNILCAPK